MTCEHPHTTCDSCGEGLTAMGPPLRPSPDTDAGLDVERLARALLKAGVAIWIPKWDQHEAAVRIAAEYVR